MEIISLAQEIPKETEAEQDRREGTVRIPRGRRSLGGKEKTYLATEGREPRIVTDKNSGGTRKNHRSSIGAGKGKSGKSSGPDGEASMGEAKGRREERQSLLTRKPRV